MNRPKAKALKSANPDGTKKLYRSVSGNKGDAKPLSARQKFLQAYEANFGNITVACDLAGISRQTFYRWKESPSRTNTKFRKQIERIKPEERLVDFLEMSFVKRVREGSDSLIQFGLRTKGRERGWVENPDPPKLVDRTELDEVARRFQWFLNDHGHTLKTKERLTWLRRFAERGHVDPLELAKRFGHSVDKL